MNELTELQVKFFAAQDGVVFGEDEVTIDVAFLGEDAIILPSLDVSPLVNVMSAAGNSAIPARDVAFILYVLSLSDIDIASAVHQTLRKYAASANEPPPVPDGLPVAFAQEFAGYLS